MSWNQLAGHLCRQWPLDPAFANWGVTITLALPHLLYAWIWLRPGDWLSLFGKKNAVEAFAHAAYFGKVLQFEAVAMWVWASRPGGLCLDLSAIQLWQWLAFLLLFSFGQALNTGVYRAIGTTGVYYGIKLGRKVPWATGFPFSVAPHPQYFGSALSVWGVAAILLNQLPTDWSIASPLGGPPLAISTSALALAVYWTLLYVVTGWQEQYL